MVNHHPPSDHYPRALILLFLSEAFNVRVHGSVSFKFKIRGNEEYQNPPRQENEKKTSFLAMHLLFQHALHVFIDI